MVRTQIQLTERQAAQLRELAAKEDASVAELVRRGVDLILAEASPPPQRSRLDALQVAGRFDSRAPGIARRHDDELSDAYLDPGGCHIGSTT